MAPLPNTRLIHPRWQKHYTPTVAAGMGATVRLSKPGRPGARNPITGVTAMLPPVRYYQGPGRVQALGGATPAAPPSERDVAVGPYLVAVPADLGAREVPEIGDVVDVLDGAGDPMLTGARLYVVEIPLASIILQRNLGCDFQQPAAP